MEVSAYQGSTATTSQSSTNNPLGKDAFLQILVAQLQNQDPLSGGDNTEYIAQLAQFSALEQMENLNTSFQEMIYSQNTQYASQLLGKEVTLTNDDQVITGEVEKIKLNNGNVYIVIDGNEYGLENIQSVEEVEEIIEEEPLENENIEVVESEQVASTESQEI